MTIQNLAGILGAKILNTPQVNKIDNFYLDANSVKSGGCCFVNSKLEAMLALKNGAYAIVGNLQAFDNEAAFLFSDDLKNSILRLMRYFITTKKINLVFASKIQMQLLKCIYADFMLLENDIFKLFFAVQKAQNNQIMFLQYDKNLSNLSFNAKFLSNKFNIKNMTASLFYSDFVFNNIKFSINLSHIFLNELCGIFDFLYKEKINFKLKDFKDFSLFKVLFVGYKNKPLISSHRAIICVNDEEIFEFVKNKLNIQAYKNLSDIKNIEFKQFILVLCDINELKETLQQVEKEEFLF